jgi:hypothetical protein
MIKNSLQIIKHSIEDILKDLAAERIKLLQDERLATNLLFRIG